MPRHYHVGYNMPGYLPENDPDVCKLKSDALRGLKFWRDHLNEENEYRQEGKLAWGDVYLRAKRGGPDWHLWISKCYDEGPDHQEES